MQITESIQKLIKDLKKTQHGDRTNPLYDATKDFHTEGGVWKHTIRAIESLQDILNRLKGKYPQVSDLDVHKLRTAILYHDIGKIGTQTPYSGDKPERQGSYSSKGHGEKDIVDELFKKYELTVSDDIRDLITGHHFNPNQFKEFYEDKGFTEALYLIVIKIADSMSTGNKSYQQAYDHVLPFMQQISGQKEESNEGGRTWLLGILEGENLRNLLLELSEEDSYYYRGVTKQDAINSVKRGYPSETKDAMPLDWEVVEYSIGYDIEEMSEEDIEIWAQSVVEWYDGSPESVKGGLNMTMDFEHAKGYGYNNGDTIVLGLDPQSEVAEFSDVHAFARDHKNVKIVFIYFNGNFYSPEDFLKIV